MCDHRCSQGRDCSCKSSEPTVFGASMPIEMYEPPTTPSSAASLVIYALIGLMAVAAVAAVVWPIR